MCVCSDDDDDEQDRGDEKEGGETEYKSGDENKDDHETIVRTRCIWDEHATTVMDVVIDEAAIPSSAAGRTRLTRRLGSC